MFSTTPAGSGFRRRCRLYPPLINCCTIDWFDKWPLDALRSVAVSFLEASQFGKELETNAVLMEKVSKVCVEVHQSVEDETQKFFEEMRRRYYTTPTSYTEFISLYLSKLSEKRAEFNFSKERLRTGLKKLSDANALVGTMQSELLQLGPKLELKAKVWLTKTLNTLSATYTNESTVSLHPYTVKYKLSASCVSKNASCDLKTHLCLFKLIMMCCITHHGAP